MNRHQDQRSRETGTWTWRIVRGWELGLCGLCVLLAAACAPRQEPANPKPAQIVELPLNSLAAAWRAELPVGTGRLKRLMCDEQNVYAYSNDGRFFWISRSRGRTVSMSQVAEAGDAMLDVVSLPDRVIVPTSSRFTVFDRQGAERHTVRFRYPPTTPAAGDGKTIFLGIDYPAGPRIMALPTGEQPYRPTPDWQLMPPAEVKAAPAAYEGTVFMATVTGAVVAVRADDRGMAWPLQSNGMFQTGGPIVAPLSVDKDGVYAASSDTKLYCLDLQDGHVRWSYYAGQPLGAECAPVPTASTVYFYLAGTGLVAVDKSARQEIRKAKWIVEEARQFLASDDAYAYLRSANNSIIAVDKQTGQVKLRSTRNDFAVFATNTSAKDGTIYAGTADGVVYGIRLVTKPGTKGELVFDMRPMEIAAR